MPAPQNIDTPALNAIASGLREGQYSRDGHPRASRRAAIDDLEAVLAHELTDIRDRDTR
jgi:heat shock protein HtpX